MFKKRQFSLSIQLLLFSSSIVLIAIIIMGILFTFFLNKRFDSYIIRENSEARTELVRNLSQYLAASGTVDPQWMEQISNVYMEQGMFFSINSPEGDVMWSCMDDNESMCRMHMAEQDLEQIDNLENTIYEVPIGSGGETTVLNVSYTPLDSYSENDRFFLQETYRMLLISILITLALSTILSFALSRSLSRPILHLAEYATRLANHDYSASGKGRSKIIELNILHESVDNLASSLESQEILRKRLSSDVSHELRTPLTSIQSSLEAMIDGIWNPDIDKLNVCRNEILRLTKLVDRLDDLHRYDNKPAKPDYEKIDLRKSLNSVVLLFENDIEKKEIDIDFKCPDIYIYGAPNQLKQVWINLLSNAIKFTNQIGLIKISVEQDKTKKQVLIRFTNSGRGIDAEDLPLIFERFYIADPSRKTGGSGLGLAIVKEIIELHNGNVSAESIKDLETTIIITLPLN